eukprot:TRINITY_DN13295_c0_g1_i1.p1 TRINITY_DN13295_c0_g1~~TRINITY_DN13295_c0_g1_i1.p1  ORF type:complete len:214 (+),score=65.22 TRINITY_DN13295_c0_g1_i1:82-723(+)
MSVSALSPTRAVLMQAQLRQTSAATAYAAPQPAGKLDTETLQKSIERLHKTKPPPKDPGPLTEKKVVPKSQIEESVSRLYDQAMVKKKQNTEQAAKKAMTPEFQSKKITGADLEDAVQRHYTQAIKQKETQRQALDMKLRSGGGNYAKPQKRQLAKEAMEEANSRLFKKPMEHRAEIRTKLEAKYVEGSLPSFPKKTEAERGATSQRLYSGGQ